MANKLMHGCGVEPVDAEREGLDPPFCPHGPTLAFERYYADRKPRRFFACAVYRDRKGCSFFHWVDEPITAEKRMRWRAEYEQTQPTLDRRMLTQRLKVVRSYSKSKRHFCTTCGSLLLEEEWKAHGGHGVRWGVGEEELGRPSRWLTAVKERKSQAQFHFSQRTTEFLCSELQRQGFTRVLCVGTPRLHETFLESASCQSLLLDIDHRYAQFFPPDQYQRYSMFNNHFYEPEGEGVCQRFLRVPTPVAMVIDPPFGGLVAVLAHSIRKLWAVAGKELPTVLVFPYFMESHVTSALPSLTMTDYQVTYENHRHFSADRAKSKPSPVRLFTNLPPPHLTLPTEEGYRLCKLCNRYVSSRNVHCKKCNSCTSKDGRQYVHCDQCGKCVKTGRVHCLACGRCELPSHPCETRSPIGCHVCGSLEHKRRECPQREESTTGGGGRGEKRRRKAKDGGKRGKVKRRRVDSTS